MIVAIDGGVASGKSAVGRRLAAAIGLPFVDSGLMYRAVAYLADSRDVDPDDPEALARLAEGSVIEVDGPHVRVDGEEVTSELYDAARNGILAQVSASPGVRRALVRRQRQMAGDGVVMAGRDIGTVVFPEADFKFFLVAQLEERIRRRAAQFGERGESVARDDLAREVAERDRQDTEREASPLRPAVDAEIVETDGLELDEVVDLLARRVEQGRG